MAGPEPAVLFVPSGTGVFCDMATVLLLLASNIFMTLAWYGHLKFPQSKLWAAILISWGIAFFEYCLQVPANRLGYTSGFSAFQLKVIQEVITLSVFVVFAWMYLGERPRWNHALACVLIVGAVYLSRMGGKDTEAPQSPEAPSAAISTAR